MGSAESGDRGLAPFPLSAEFKPSFSPFYKALPLISLKRRVPSTLIKKIKELPPNFNYNIYVKRIG
ncbi:MAG: hypothetical protein D6780_06260 [Candidatus Dadabacteria bacterium]|nr:MAG: hypothetical protein D6780_06260 [Candidatus Dadabacteria bacterium]